MLTTVCVFNHIKAVSCGRFYFGVDDWCLLVDWYAEMNMKLQSVVEECLNLWTESKRLTCFYSGVIFSSFLRPSLYNKAVVSVYKILLYLIFFFFFASRCKVSFGCLGGKPFGDLQFKKKTSELEVSWVCWIIYTNDKIAVKCTPWCCFAKSQNYI